MYTYPIINMIKYSLLLISLFIIPFTVSAQRNILTSGDSFSNNSGSVSYSIGQISYTTQINESGSKNDGLQQPTEIYNLSTQEDNFLKDISIFPIPSQNILHIQLAEKKILLFKIYNLNGKLLKEGILDAREKNITISNLSTGSYFLKISDKKTKSQTFKIIKD